VHSKLTRLADITSELSGDVYDENQVIHIIFSAFVYFTQGGIKSKQTITQCTNHPNATSKEVHKMSQYSHSSKQLTGTDHRITTEGCALSVKPKFYYANFVTKSMDFVATISTC